MEESLASTSDVEQRALLMKACQEDRVDILQSLLTIGQKQEASPSSAKNINLKLLNCPPEHLSEGVSVLPTSLKDHLQSEASSDDYDSYEDDDETSEGQSYDYDEDDDFADDAGPSPLPYFIPPLHVAVSSGAVSTTTALLRMGADPSVVPIFPTNVELPSEVSIYTKVNKVYDFLTTHMPDKLLSSPDLVGKLKHAFTAEALRALGSDEDTRLQQLLDGGMPLTEIMAGRSILEWAEELGAVKCVKLISITDEKKIDAEPHMNDVKNSKDISISMHDNHSVQDSKIQMGIIQESQVSEFHKKSNGIKSDKHVEKLSDKTPDFTEPSEIHLPDTPLRTNVSPVKYVCNRDRSLLLELEEQQDLEKALRACLEEAQAEAAIYQAVLEYDEDNHVRFSKNGLVSKVKALKAAITQQELELEYYQQKWHEADQELENARRQFSASQFENGIIYHTVQNPTRAIKSEPNGEDVEQRNYLQSMLKKSHENVSQIRKMLTSIVESNARSQAELDALGMDGASRLANKLLSELCSIKIMVQQAKENTRQSKARIHEIRISQAAGSEKIETGDSSFTDTEESNSSTFPPVLHEAIGETPSEYSSSSPLQITAQTDVVLKSNIAHSPPRHDITENDQIDPVNIFIELAGAEDAQISLHDLISRWADLQEMLDVEDIYREELTAIYDSLPKADFYKDTIDLEGFLCLYQGIEDMFEYDDEIETASKTGSHRIPSISFGVWDLLRRMVGISKRDIKENKLLTRNQSSDIMTV